MAFETLTQEAVHMLYDPGIFYTDDGPKMGPFGDKIRLHTVKDEDCLDTPHQDKLYPSILTFNTTSTRTAPSLFDICADFVAENISRVDSLLGFPELIGECLFKRVRDNGKLKASGNEPVTILRKFTDAYGSLVCSSFVQRHSFCFVEYAIPAIIECFSTLVVLDVNGCKLGDDHDLMKSISEMKHLEKIGLSNNCLSDKAIQNITLPLRMFKKGPANLLAMNLSDNPRLTDRVVRFVSSFTRLRDLDLSRTQLTEVGISKIASSMNLLKLKLVDLTEKPCVLGTPALEGWAAGVLEDWMTESEAAIKRLITTKPKTSIKFYGTQRKKIEEIQDFQAAQVSKLNDALCQLDQTPLIFQHKDDIDTEYCKPENKMQCKSRHSSKNSDRPVIKKLAATKVLDVLIMPDHVTVGINKKSTGKRKMSEQNGSFRKKTESSSKTPKYNSMASEISLSQTREFSVVNEIVRSSEERNMLAGYLTENFVKSKPRTSLLDALGSF